jgi:AI-2 transport protein TqsA
VPETPSTGSALRALVIAASLIVVIAGLEAAADVLLPLLFSSFLAILAAPVVLALRRLRIPGPLAILFVVLLVAGALVAFTAIVAETVRTFSAELPRYEAPLQDLVRLALDQLRLLGLQAPEIQDLGSYLEPSSILEVVGQTVNAVVGVVSRLLIVTVTLTFILLEATDVTDKIKVAFGADVAESGMAKVLTDASHKVQRYLAIKTIVSLATGLLAWLLVGSIGVDFPLLWALLAFLMNYIPSIGSIVAAIPPVLLAMVQLGPGWAAAVAVGYLVINVTLGNFIEPRLLGRSLGISPLIVILSLLFWGWVWGPVGMLFSVPMTVIAKLVLESYEDTRWMAVMLGNARDLDAYRNRPRPAP